MIRTGRGGVAVVGVWVGAVVVARGAVLDTSSERQPAAAPSRHTNNNRARCMFRKINR
jgi:hypothetical protein